MKKTLELLKNKETKTRLLLLAALFFSCLFIFREYIFGELVMVYDDVGGDTWQQYTMHYASVVEHLRAGNFSLWDFTNGFGTNQFCINLFDPSLMLLYLIGVILGPAHMLYYLVWLQILKILAAGWIFYWFLSEFSYSRQARLCASFVYGLNGYLLVWGQHYQFGMVTIYLPLILLFEEKMLRRKKGGGFFPVTVFFCGLYSVYFSYMTLIGAGFYLLFRIVMMDELTWKKRISQFLSGCGQMLLGIGMSMAVFLPMVQTLSNSSRIEAGSGGLWKLLRQCFSTYGDLYYETLSTRIFSSNLQNLQTLEGSEYEGMWNYYEDPVLFCSTLAVIFGVQFLFIFWKSNEKKRVKAAIYAAVALISAIVLLPLGGTAFNAFTAPTHRYTYLLTVVFLLVFAWMWDYLRAKGKISVIALAVTTVWLVWTYWNGYVQSVLPEARINAIVLAVTGCVMVICVLLLSFWKREKSRKFITVILTAVLAVNVLSESAMTYTDRTCLRKTDTPVSQLTDVILDHQEAATSDDPQIEALAQTKRPQTYFTELYRQDIQDALAYLRETDPQFYRVEKDFSSATISMDSLAQGYRGISTYNSIMNGNVKEFVQTCYPEFLYLDQNRYTFWQMAQDNGFAAFTGVRYLLSRSGDLDEEKYELIGQFGGIYLYKNAKQAEVARFYENTISEESFKNLCKKKVREKNRELILENALAIEGGDEISDISELKEASQEQKDSSVILNAPEKDSYVTGTILAKTDGYVLCMIPYEKGWSVSIDGEEVETQRGDLGFLSFAVAQGEYELVLRFEAPGLKTGMMVSAVCWGVYLLLSWRRKTHSQNIAH